MIVKENWWVDFFNGEYGELVVTSPDRAKQVVDFIGKLCRDIPENSTLFDQCCGKGHLSNAFASMLNLNVYGIDAAKKYIEFAKNEYGNDKCKFIEGDARIHLLDSKADIAINWNSSFAYCEDDSENIKMLETLSDNLKIGGKFIISTYNPEYIYKYFQRFWVRYVPYQDSSIITIKECFIEDAMLKSTWVFVYPDGKRETQSGQTKLYSVQDFINMFDKVGLSLEATYGNIDFEDFTEDSPSLILFGKKCNDRIKK